MFVGRHLGSGLGWLLDRRCAARVGNLLDAALQPEDFHSIGASTATFATIGIVGAFVWRRGYYRAVDWRRSVAPVFAADRDARVYRHRRREHRRRRARDGIRGRCLLRRRRRGVRHQAHSALWGSRVRRRRHRDRRLRVVVGGYECLIGRGERRFAYHPRLSKNSRTPETAHARRITSFSPVGIVATLVIAVDGVRRQGRRESGCRSSRESRRRSRCAEGGRRRGARDEAAKLGVEAVAYGLPLMIAELTRRVPTNVAAPRAERARAAQPVRPHGEVPDRGRQRRRATERRYAVLVRVPRPVQGTDGAVGSRHARAATT